MKPRTPEATFGVQFKTSKYERRLIGQIVDRIIAQTKPVAVQYDRRDAEMDLTACHCNGMPLELHRLLNAPDADFWHDVYGIRRHLNRHTGKLEDFFVPRTALPE